MMTRQQVVQRLLPDMTRKESEATMMVEISEGR